MRYLASHSFMSTVALAAALAGTLGGCVVAPLPQQQVVYRNAPAPYHQPSPVYIDIAPPPPQVEVVGMAPAPGLFWIGGVWLWEGQRHVWHPGHWEPHRQGFQWTPHQWVRDGRGWHVQGGHWSPR